MTALSCTTAVAQPAPPAPVTQIAVVVRADDPPLIGADGVPAAAGTRRLAEMDTALRELAAVRVPFAISASPVWVDELLIAEQTRLYASLLAIATRHPLLNTPYAHILLPHEPDAAAATRELAHGDAALRQTLQAASQRILDPPGLALSGTALQSARAAGVRATLASASVVGPEPVSFGGMTFIPTAEVSAPSALVERYGPQARVAIAGPPTRGLVATLKALAGDKRVKLVSISDLAERAPAGRIELDPVGRPPASYTAAVADADDAAAGFASYTLAGNPTGKMLQVLLARARSTADWQRDWGRGTARAEAVTDLAGAEQSLVSAAGGSVTLTSRRGAVPVTIVNRARYPVRLRVRVKSPKLAFPSGETRLETISPRGVTVTFVAEARSSGSFPMDVSLESPDGRVHFGGGRVLVRSTAANVLALVLTVSGLLFLVAWSSRDLIRKALGRDK